MASHSKSLAMVVCSGLVWLTSGCPDASVGHPTQACSKAYDKCVLQGGVLGVCNPSDCREGQAPPCFVCRSQH